ncbi:hypothetical protein Ais01nite_19190 [Asanoa ishikariensis]|uniref:Peptidase inhibitor family I36 n=1 Tax=Asanoa ishikariensis TaxID=137265 RepID=A0A1H3UC60_9ACTN|nr:hypothetical protein [Asanoa ishikariensis]GIF63884.1 hypothetical protein Ais01nite_19190 [Asanoa ishikariensis]SDZ59907.1 hypothetical protein SAMN05421684_6955 [Asanoa ishikariensis]
MGIKRQLAIGAGVLASLLLAPTSAHAAPAGRHCVVSASTGAAMVCYSSFRTAITNATGGRVTDAPGDAKAALNDEKLATKLNDLPSARSNAPMAAAASNIVISVEYTGEGFGGSSLTITGTHACDNALSPVEFTMASMPSGWNDDIESFRAFANCAAMHFLHIGASGPFNDNGFFFSRTSFPSWLDDEVSSIAWT